MKLKNLQRDKKYAGDRIHIFADRRGERINLYQGYVYLIQAGLLEHEILEMGYRASNALEVKINW